MTPDAWNNMSKALRWCSRDACFTLPRLARVAATESFSTDDDLHWFACDIQMICGEEDEPKKEASCRKDQYTQKRPKQCCTGINVD